MIKQEYFGKQIELVDIDNKAWRGRTSVITAAADSESGENEIAIERNESLILFKESEIKNIELI